MCHGKCRRLSSDVLKDSRPKVKAVGMTADTAIKLGSA